jgi:hypothetical protein
MNAPDLKVTLTSLGFIKCKKIYVTYNMERTCIDKLLVHYQQQKHKEHQIYKTILYGVQKRIESRNKQGLFNTVYYIPFIVYGNTRYKYDVCLRYVFSKLTRDGFFVMPVSSNALYVDWSVVKSMYQSAPKSRINKDTTYV